MDCAMATGFRSKRALGFAIPFRAPFPSPLSALPSSSSSSAQFFPDSFIIASASTRVHAPRHDYWLSWRIHRGISSAPDEMRSCVSFSLSPSALHLSFVRLLSIKAILPSYPMIQDMKPRVCNATNPFIDRLNPSVYVSWCTSTLLVVSYVIRK